MEGRGPSVLSKERVIGIGLTLVDKKNALFSCLFGSRRRETYLVSMASSAPLSARDSQTIRRFAPDLRTT